MDFPPSNAESTINLEVLPFLAATLTPLAQLQYPLNPIGLGYDMRQFSSFYFSANASTTALTATSPPIQVSMTWLALHAGVTYLDTWEFFVNGSNSNQFFGGTFSAQDVVHGPFLQITIANNSPTQTISYNFSLVGTSRVLPGPYSRQQNGADGTMLLLPGAPPIPINTTLQFPCNFGYGRTWLHTAAVASQLIFVVNSGSLGTLDSFAVPAGANDRRELVIPKRSLRIDIQNGPTAPTAYGAVAIQQFDKV